MTADYTYDPGLLFNPETGTIIRDQGGKLYASADATDPVTMYDLLRNVITEVRSTQLGLIVPFKADIPDGVVRFGTYNQPVISQEGQRAGLQAQAAQAAAEDARDLAAASAQTAQGVLGQVGQVASDLDVLAAAAVRSVNSTLPDAFGNVVIDAGGGDGTVTSVNGKLPNETGQVTLVPADLNLDPDLANLALEQFPVSDAVTLALAGKAADSEITDTALQNSASSVRGLITGRRLWNAFLVFMAQAGIWYTVDYNGTTWPAISTVPAAYIATGKPIIWRSADYLSAAAPPESRNGIDYWLKRVAA